jgi:hypothetical protein
VFFSEFPMLGPERIRTHIRHDHRLGDRSTRRWRSRKSVYRDAVDRVHECLRQIGRAVDIQMVASPIQEKNRTAGVTSNLFHGERDGTQYI